MGGLTVTARFTATVAGPILDDALIVVENGHIAAIEPRAGRSADHDFGRAIIVPGFVNAHTHLDLNGALNQSPPQGSFPSWLRSVIAFRRNRAADAVAGDIESGIRQSLAAGVTLVGDISDSGASWDALAASPLKAIVYHELLGLTVERCDAALAAGLAWVTAHPASTRVRPGLSPHAPYSFRFDGLARAAAMEVPIAIHFAESWEELELIVEHAGEFVPFLEELGAWDPSGLPGKDSIAKPLATAKLLSLIHGNYLPGDAPLPANASMVYCPRTHDAFGHPDHPFREWLARGINVALGTDSLASNPDLSILGEARFLASEFPDVDPATILQLATLNGARALGFDTICGSLEVGRAADFCVIPVGKGRDPLKAMLSSATPVQAAFADGVSILRSPGS